jgi:hypothetical protein
MYSAIYNNSGTKSPTLMWAMEDDRILLIAQASSGSMETLYNWWTGA